MEGWQRDDVKAPPLKALQGLIWAQGYAEGAFSIPIYPDALEAMRCCRSEGFPLYVYSSGSLQAQELFFQHSAAGDLRPLFAGRFDTTVGAKIDAASYARVAARIGAAPAAILFCSDNPAELAAAEAVGLKIAHVVKDGARPDPRWPAVGDFSEILSRWPETSSTAFLLRHQSPVRGGGLNARAQHGRRGRRQATAMLVCASRARRNGQARSPA